MLPNVFQKIKFPNGLRLITVPLRQVRSVTVLILAAAGSRYETKETRGLSHFLEHMFFKGTEKRPTPLDVFSPIDSVGGEFNASTGKDAMEFYIKLPSSHFPLALDVLSDCLLYSLFAPKEIEREKGVIFEEINLRNDRPLVKVADLFEKLLYDDTPLGWETVGTKERVARFKREDFLNWTGKFFLPSNLVITVAGDFKKDQAEKLVSSYFASLPKKKPPIYRKIKDRQKEPQVLLQFKKTDQAHIVLGVRAYPLKHRNRYILSLLNIILGGNASSRLFGEVREKRGLAYYIHSSKQAYLDVGYWAVYAGLDIKRIEEGIKVILKEMRLVKEKGVEKEELKRAKEYLKGRLALSLEDSHRVASFYGEQELLEGEIKTPEQISRELEKVTVEDIQKVAQEIFLPEKLNLAIIGPYKDRGRFRKLLVL